MLAVIGIATFLLLAIGDMTLASNSCSYIYKVPRSSGAACDAKGGIDADLLDRVWSLKGGIQGIKLIGQANQDVMKNFQNQIKQVQQQYGQYSSVLVNLQKQITDLKMILNAVPDELGVDEIEDSSRVARAVDPNKALRAALSMAEWKLINATMVLHDAEKKRQQLENTLEKRIKDHETRVQAVLSKIKNIENSISKIPAAAAMVGKPVSNAVQREIANLTNKVIGLLVDVNVMTRLSGNKASDLTKKLDTTKTPLAKSEKTVNDLKNISNSMNATFARIDTSVQDLLNTVVNATQQIDPLYQQLRVDENAMFNKYSKVQKDYNSVNSRVAKEEADLMTQRADLAWVNQTLATCTTDFKSMKTIYDKYKQDYKALGQYPVLKIGSVDYYAHEALKKQNAALAQLQRMVGVMQGQVNNINKTLTASG